MASIAAASATANALHFTLSSHRSKARSTDFETFLKMLTTQAQYQNPLEPLDSSEYAAQLAQFSMVEQQLQTNESLASLVASMTATDVTQLVDWVGLEAQIVAPA